MSVDFLKANASMSMGGSRDKSEEIGSGHSFLQSRHQHRRQPHFFLNCKKFSLPGISHNGCSTSAAFRSSNSIVHEVIAIRGVSPISTTLAVRIARTPTKMYIRHLEPASAARQKGKDANIYAQDENCGWSGVHWRTHIFNGMLHYLIGHASSVT